MRLSVLVILGLACLAVTTHPAEASRTKRTIGSWFSKLWKRWKKEPEPDYDYQRPVYAIRQPVYHPPPKPSYGPPPSYHAPPIHVQHGGHGGGHVKGGHGGGIAIGGHGGGHAIGGHGGGHAIGGHGGGHAIGGHGGGHGKGGHGKGGHGKGGGGIPHGFGPVKHSDVLGGGQSYGPPPSEYGPPPAESYIAPPVETYGAPPPAPAPVIPDSYSAPSIAAPVPAPVSVQISAPAPVIHEQINIPVVSEPSNDYRAPPSFPPPMAAHGSSSSSYLEGSFQPSQQLPIEQALPAPALPAPPAPLYDLPVGPDTPRVVPDGAPAPIEVNPPAPLALETVFEEPRSTGGNIGTVVATDIIPDSQGGYSAPSVDYTYGSQLGVEDPIIEIVFQDGEPLPPPPPPIIDPELFALQDDDVEVYFIEYAPGDNLDDLAALSLDGAQPAILHDLPQELPVDVRSQLVGSGILEDAEIQVIDLEDALSDDLLDDNVRTALDAALGAESRLHKTIVDAPEEDVAVKIHRLLNEQGSPKSTAELLSRLQNYREGRYVGVVKSSDNSTDRYLPLTIDGEKIPLPNSLDLSGQKIAEVLVVANSDDDDGNQEPPANTNDPEYNLVAEASNLKPVIVAAEAIPDGIDRQWHGQPDSWRPVWN